MYKPIYYIFSDYKLNSNLEEIFPNNRYFIIDTNNKDKSAFIDLWLMTQMQNHIIANSTFSWWGAWLSDYDNKIIISPNINIKNNEGYWNPNIYNNNEWISI